VQVTAAPGFDAQQLPAHCQTVLESAFAAQEIGEPLRLAGLIHRLMELPSVENCRITAPSADQLYAQDEIAVAGSITVQTVVSAGAGV
jgi:uncharacterized phage protein gp47/JayE